MADTPPTETSDTPSPQAPSDDRGDLTVDALLARVERVREASRARREAGSGVYRHPDYVPPRPLPPDLDIPEERRWWDR